MCWCVQTHLSFGREFTEAVEMKQVAQQEAERARFLVEKVRTHTHMHYSPSCTQLQWNLLIRDTLVHRPLSLIRRLSLIGRFGIKPSFYALLQHQ